MSSSCNVSSGRPLLVLQAGVFAARMAGFNFDLGVGLGASNCSFFRGLSAAAAGVFLARRAGVGRALGVGLKKSARERQYGSDHTGKQQRTVESSLLTWLATAQTELVSMLIIQMNTRHSKKL